MTPNEFLMRHLGARLDAEQAGQCRKITKMVVPQASVKKGTAPLRVGGIPLFYVVTPERAVIAGRVHVRSTPSLTNFVMSSAIPKEERIRPEVLLAPYIVDNTEYPMMVGVIERVDHTLAAKITLRPNECFYCHATDPATIDLIRVREVISAMGDTPFKELEKALKLHSNTVRPMSNTVYEDSRIKLSRLLEKQPEMRQLLKVAGRVQLFSREYWLINNALQARQLSFVERMRDIYRG